MTLDTYYPQLLAHVNTAQDALLTYQRVVLAQTWGVTDDKRGSLDDVKARAIKTVETRLLQLCEFAGVRSRQCAGLTDQVYALQEAAKRDRETIARLETALHHTLTRTPDVE